MGTLLGKKIGPYQVKKLLGKGGMGEVYLAIDQQLDRYAALKVLKPELSSDANFIQRFTQEAKTLAQLNHTHIATLYTILQDEEKYIMAMEYIDGDPFDEYLSKKGRITPSELLPIITAVLDGLSHAHAKGIVHRDMKPSNIMFNKLGVAKVMDFGIARAAKDDRQTKEGMIIGTLDYMAPELIKGEDASYASDLYAIGIIMYQALSGKLPFSETSEYKLMQAHINTKPIKLSSITTNSPAALVKYIHQLLQKEPSKRFKSTEEALNSLKELSANLSLVNSNNNQNSTGQTAAPKNQFLETLKSRWQVLAFSFSILILMFAAMAKFSGSSELSASKETTTDDSSDRDGASFSGSFLGNTSAAGKTTESQVSRGSDKLQDLISLAAKLADEKKYLGEYPSLYLVVKDILNIEPKNNQALSWMERMIESFYQEGMSAAEKNDLTTARENLEFLANAADNDERYEKLKAKIENRGSSKSKATSIIKSKPKTNKKSEKYREPYVPVQKKYTPPVVNPTKPKKIYRPETDENFEETKKTPVDKIIEIIKKEDTDQGKRQVTLNVNDPIEVMLAETVHTDMDLKIGQHLSFKLSRPLGGKISNVEIKGKIIQVKKSTNFREGLIEFNINMLVGPNGERVYLRKGRQKVRSSGRVTIASGSSFTVFAGSKVNFQY